MWNGFALTGNNVVCCWKFCIEMTVSACLVCPCAAFRTYDYSSCSICMIIPIHFGTYRYVLYRCLVYHIYIYAKILTYINYIYKCNMASFLGSPPPYLTSAWIINCPHRNVWDAIIYPLQNFSSTTLSIWDWRSNFIQQITEHLIQYG